MKKVIVTALLLTGLTGFAQRGEHHGEKGSAMRDMTPEQVATLQTKKMTLALNLSEDQQGEIQKLNLKNATARKAKMEERKALKEAEEAKKPSSEERFAMKNARLDQAIQQKEKMKEILSDSQFEKLEKMHAKRGHHGKGKGKPKKGRSKHKG